MKTKLIAVLLMAFASVLFAQKYDYSSEPGYVDFGNLASLDAGKSATEVLIEKNLLKMVAKMSKSEEPDLFNLLSGLKLIKVNVFEIDSTAFGKAKDKIEKLTKDLSSSGWDRLVKTRGEKENASVLIKTQGEDNIVGLVVMTVDKGGEAAFVNIVGKIDLETIGSLSGKFDVPGLENVK
ncbi:MAG: DUF4252 domain-containing protein [Melioribacteraceae bacterium]|jgi:hypothetical protein|nr:hypothetical protein [Ignavibacteriota bacterium]MBZ0183100.1 DUF4252 domain-containing protein [Melioribacteraceae bacterium]